MSFFGALFARKQAEDQPAQDFLTALQNAKKDKATRVEVSNSLVKCTRIFKQYIFGTRLIINIFIIFSLRI